MKTVSAALQNWATCVDSIVNLAPTVEIGKRFVLTVGMYDPGLLCSGGFPIYISGA